MMNAMEKFYEREVKPVVDNVYAEAEAKEALLTRAADQCTVEWGNCTTGAAQRHWGAPSDTPHRCNGKATHVRRAIGKLHACEKCNCLGGRTMPSPYSKAGAQLRQAIMASEGLTK